MISSNATFGIPPVNNNLNVVDSIRTQLIKRITSLQYIKSAYQGQVYWFNVSLLFFGLF